MPKAFDDMVSAIKSSLKKENPKMSDKELSSKAYAMATANWKKSHGGKMPGRESLKDWRLLEFFVPIEEKVFDESTDEFFIRGVAINETTTLNNVKYIANELEMAAPSFRNVPILLDHKNEVKNIVGRTTENVNFNSSMKRIDFEGRIMDKDIREMIRDGRLQNVSIGAKVSDLVEESDGSKKAVGIKGLEISLVAVPGDNQASLAQAIQQCFHLKEMANVEESVYDNPEELNKNGDKMAEEEVKQTEEEKEEVVESEPVAEKVVNKTDSIVESQMEELKKLKEILAEKKKVQEEIKALDVKESKEVKVQEVKVDETKGEVGDVAQESISDDFVIESTGKGLALYTDFERNSKLKRFVRH